MGRSTNIRKLHPERGEGAAARAAMTWLKNKTRRKMQQFFEGVVTAKDATDATVTVRIPYASAPLALPVSYSTCNAAAFDVGDHALVFAANCDIGKAVVIGFTRNTKACCAAEAQVFALSGTLTGNERRRSDLQAYLVDIHGGALTQIGVSISATGSVVERAEELERYEQTSGTGKTYLIGGIYGGTVRVRNTYTDYVGEWPNPGFYIDPLYDDYTYVRKCWPINTTLAPFSIAHQLWPPNGGAFYGVAHSGHYHQYFPATVASSVVETSGFLGESSDPFVVARFTSILTDPDDVPYLTIPSPGFAWTGMPYVDQLGVVVVEGNLNVGHGAGVIAIDVLMGTRTQLWTAGIPIADVATYDVYHQTYCTYASAPPVASSLFPTPQEAGRVFGAACLRIGQTPPSYTPATTQTLPPTPGSPQSKQPWEDSGAFAAPGDPGLGNSGWSAASEFIAPTERYVHYKRIVETLLDGPPSPPIMVADGETYILAPAIRREFQHLLKVPATWFTPGVSRMGPAFDILNLRQYMTAQGEVERKQMLYRIRLETGSATLLQDDDVTTSRFNVANGTNELLGPITINAMESRSNWRRKIYSYERAIDPNVPRRLYHWWNVSRRRTGYDEFTGSGDGTVQDIETPPLVSPIGDQLTRLNDAVPTAAGNWQPLEHPLAGKVAAWTFSWRAKGNSPYNPQPNYTDDLDYSGTAKGHEGDDREPADYQYDPEKYATAHGESFKVYDVKTWAVYATLLEGALTNPGSYLTHPCVTPDGKVIVTVAHGFFRVPPLSWRFFAGLYRIDLTPLAETPPKDPVITLLSPCELRAPAGRPLQIGSDVVSGPLATGQEVVEGGADDSLLFVSSPSLVESRIAYYVGRRRKSFLDRAGNCILSEAGVGLNVRPGSSVRLVKFLARDIASVNGVTANNQDVDLSFRATFPQLHGMHP